MTALGETAVAIRSLRGRRGWTQARLAQELGTDPVTVSRWERGATHPRRVALRQLVWLGLSRLPNSSVGFTEDPTIRIRKLDRARREQLEMKERVRFRR